MPTVRFRDASYLLEDGESVLAGLLRHGVSWDNSCRAGVCGSCMMQVTSGDVPAKAQAGLKEAWKRLGYFLACVCVPEADLAIAAPGDGFRHDAVIHSIEALSADVARVKVTADQPLDFRAGQYVTLVRQDGLARSYSMASLPGEPAIELHVRRVPNGAMSGWLHAGARPGDRVSLLGPSGECFYLEGRETQPLLLTGTGTGLAPLYGILRDALTRGHNGPIHLLHGALRRNGLYLVDELRALDDRHPQFHYTPTVLDGQNADNVVVGRLDHIIDARFPDLTGWRGFVCGDPGLVQGLKKALFLSGMASRDIHADAFIPAANRGN